MATLEQLYDSFLQADAAGDVELAQALADEIRRLEKEENIALEKPKVDLQEEEEKQASRQIRRQAYLETAKNIADVPIAATKGAVIGTVGTASLPSVFEQAKEYVFSKLPYGDLSSRLMEASPLGVKTEYAPTMEQLMTGLRKIPGVKQLTEYQPRTLLGEYSETAGEFIGPSLIPAFIKKSPQMAKTAGILGGIGAATQETQEQIGLSPLAAMPLTFATTLIGGYAMGPSKAQEYARQALKGVSDDELRLAAALEDQANELGLSITAAELIDNKIINSLGSIVYGSKEGGKIMYDYLKDRPQEVEKIAKKLMDTMIENPESLRKVYKKVGTTADDALANAKRDRRKAAREAGYAVADTEYIQPNQVLNIIDDIDKAILGLPTKDPAIKKLKEIKTRLIKNVEYENIVDPVTGKESIRKIVTPQTNVKILDRTLKEFKGYVDSSRAATPDAKMQKNYMDDMVREYFNNPNKNGVLDVLDKELRTNVNYANAKDTFEKISNEVVDVVYLHTKDLQKKNITPTTITGFIANPKNANPLDVEKTYKILNKQDPAVFPSIVRLYIEDAARNAFKLQPGGPSLKQGFKLIDNLAGKNKANFNAMMKGVADAYGVNEKTLLLGIDKFDEVLQRTARIVDIDNPSYPPNPKNLASEAAQWGSFMWQVKYASKFGQYINDKTVKELARVLTKKESVNAFIDLAKKNPDSKDAAILVTRIIAGFNPLFEEQQEQYLQELPQQQIQAPPE